MSACCSGFRCEVSVTRRQVRLQKEANRRIAELSEKAHSEAVRYAPPQPPPPSQPPCIQSACVCRNLGDRTREVYRENVRMSEALALHSAHVEELEQRTKHLEEANRYKPHNV